MINLDIHCQKRAMERYGIYLKYCDLKRIVNKIHKGDATYIGRGVGEGVSIWHIRYREESLYPVVLFYDRKILTFLTKTMAYKCAKRQRELAKNT